MHNDEPTLIDTLERAFLTNEVGEAIAHCNPPQVFGIHGDWGLGKTSFLHQLQLHLTGTCPQQPQHHIRKARTVIRGAHKNYITAVWFDAWRYQYEQVPVVALLQEMRSQLSLGNQLRSAVRRETEVAIRGALFSLEEVTKKIGFQYSQFVEARRDWETNNLATALPSHTLREHLRTAISQLLPQKKDDGTTARLVIFIDDLDRCEPEIAYRLLEGLKIYLTLDNCVFVLGMNQKAVAEAIATKLGLSSSNAQEGSSDVDNKINIRATAYMEKLCQNVWQLPTISDPAKMLNTLLQNTVRSRVSRELIIEAVGNTRCLPPNPRRLKGLANVIGRMCSRLAIANEGAELEDKILEAKKLLIVAYIYHFHSDLYVRWEAEPNFYNKIWDRCKGEETDIPSLAALVLPTREVSDESSPTPQYLVESTFPDPSEANVFWIQSLIVTMGTEVGPEQFEPYLYRQTT